ncbi:MAG: hypothetical protein ACLU18_16195 [Bacteroides thetaiotaomicron]
MKGKVAPLLLCRSFVRGKGVRMLLEVAEFLPFPLYIAGDGPLLNELQAKYSSGNVIFLGHLSSMEIVRLGETCADDGAPSIWYENNPLM